MVTSSFDLFKIGVGPSSSHTMGPMTAAADFAARAAGRAVRVEVDLFGSLALTGRGHATDRAVLLGLAGNVPADIDPDAADAQVREIRASGCLPLGGGDPIAFDEGRDLRYLTRERLDFHSNAMTCIAFDVDGVAILRRTYYSVGGGAVLDEDQVAAQAARDLPLSGGNAGPPLGDDAAVVPHPFRSGAELLARAVQTGKTIARMMRENEEAALAPAEVSVRLGAIRDAMSACIDRGIRSDLSELPGGLRVKRRAPCIHRTLLARQERALADPLTVIDWINLWALAVNEENAAGGRVVTAPTNGAAGIIPAVLRYYERFAPAATQQGVEDFLLTAAAIGALFKENASISGAEVGCQGEVGVACSMAAAGLAAALGASPGQIENAAEIGMEHNLGLTCDPVGGLVQVPCIERNAVGSVKAIEAARLAMLGDGTHRVSLDEVIETMRRTGLDMSDRYKETSLGGLAVNVVEC
ncbi:L-serine ammonia-lyase [Sphingomonas sp.]|uniref:L-serine ammonia-lyase n=1 Tax=Sphingomonas sp. TaxID=28214 RepID=UPI001EBB4398|nr:L-serine ammonia-lyase [Sphingomonas sp.]MBX3595259.1 L-serine ammonia-lyase [Sphingomonas sp.]